MEFPTGRKRIIAENSVLNFSTMFQYYSLVLYFSTMLHHYNLSKGFRNDKELINMSDKKLITHKIVHTNSEDITIDGNHLSLKH